MGNHFKNCGFLQILSKTQKHKDSKKIFNQSKF